MNATPSTFRIATAAGSAGGARLAGDGPELVLVHGAGGNGQCWASALAPWAGFDVWCPSLPGRPDTDGRPLASAADAATWLAGFVAGAQLERPILLGHSLGGAVVLELALGRPELVGGLVLVATGARQRVSPAILQAAARAAETGDALPSAFAFSAETAPELVDSYAAAAATTPSATALADWGAANDFDRMASLGEVRVPTLVVHGDSDALTPGKYHRFLADNIPGARRVEVAGAGHMLPWEHGRELANAVRNWSDAHALARR